VEDAVEVVNREFNIANEKLVRRITSPVKIPLWLPIPEIKKEKNEDEPQEDDFYKCLSCLVLKDEDPYLTSIFEHVLFGKEDISDKDILFM
jgi:hypothetical protein